jgi:hypothetical protein
MMIEIAVPCERGSRSYSSGMEKQGKKYIRAGVDGWVGILYLCSCNPFWRATFIYLRDSSMHTHRLAHY